MNRITLGCVLLAVAGVMGCGDDEQDAPTKAEYVKQANAICKRFNTQVERQAEKAFAGIQDESDLTPAKARAFLEDALPAYDKQIADLKALDPPKGDDDAVMKIYDIGEEEGQKLKTALKDDDAVRRLITTDSVTPRFQTASKEYGLATCASD